MTYSPKLKHGVSREVRVGERYTWEELHNIFGEFEFLSMQGMGINKTWRIGLTFDQRFEKSIRLEWAEHKPTDKSWNCHVGMPDRIYRFKIPSLLLLPHPKGRGIRKD